MVLKTLDRHITTNIPDAMTTDTSGAKGDQPTENAQAHSISSSICCCCPWRCVPACILITYPGEDTGSPPAPSHCVPCPKPPSLCRAGAPW